jgi:hypothetical protein
MWEPHNTTLALWLRMFLPTCCKELWIHLIWFFWYFVEIHGVFSDKKAYSFHFGWKWVYFGANTSEPRSGRFSVICLKNEYLFWGRTTASFDRCMHNFVTLSVWFSSVTIAADFSHLFFIFLKSLSALASRTEIYHLWIFLMFLQALTKIFSVCALGSSWFSDLM